MAKRPILDIIESFDDPAALQAALDQVEKAAANPEQKANLCRLIVYGATHGDRLRAAIQVRADDVAEAAAERQPERPAERPSERPAERPPEAPAGSGRPTPPPVPSGTGGATPPAGATPSGGGAGNG